MKLIYQSDKLVATATDGYTGPESFITAPVDYDPTLFGSYRVTNGALTIPTAEIVAAKIDALWASADKYTSSYISGVAIGILTIGVLQAKPKSLAVSAWSSSVWTEYYVRKAAVTLTSVDNHDFTSFGPIPHTVPELQVELGL